MRGTHIPDAYLQGTSHGTLELSGDVVGGPRERDRRRGIDTSRAQKRRKVLYASRRGRYEDDVSDDSEKSATDNERCPAVDVMRPVRSREG